MENYGTFVNFFENIRQVVTCFQKQTLKWNRIGENCVNLFRDSTRLFSRDECNSYMLFPLIFIRVRGSTRPTVQYALRKVLPPLRQHSRMQVRVARVTALEQKRYTPDGAMMQRMPSADVGECDGTANLCG